MKKKTMSRWMMLLIAAMIVTGCTEDTQNTDPTNNEVITETVDQEATTSAADTQEVTASIKILIDGELQTDLSQEVSVPEGTTLMEVMTENYEIVHENSFITEINSHQQDLEANRFWLYDINGEMAMVGIAEYEIEEGDVIEWKLEDSDL